MSEKSIAKGRSKASANILPAGSKNALKSQRDGEDAMNNRRRCENGTSELKALPYRAVLSNWLTRDREKYRQRTHMSWYRCATKLSKCSFLTARFALSEKTGALPALLNKCLDV